MLFDFSSVTAASVTQVIESAIADGNALVEAVVSVDGQRTFDNTLRPLEESGRLAAVAYGHGPFLGQVSTDEEVRGAARIAEVQLEKWGLDLVSRRDVYEAIRDFSKTDEAARLAGEEARVLEHALRDLRMAGHELEEGKRTEVQALRERLVELGIAFSTNIAEFDDAIEVMPDDLEGLPDGYAERLAPGAAEGSLRVSMAYPDVIPFLDNSPRRDLREALSFKFANRAREANTPILSEALRLRAAVAGIVGAESWAHYTMQVKMAKNPEVVETFFSSLLEPLQARAAEEIAALEVLLTGDGHPLPIRSWDRAYYHTVQMKTEYGVDPNKVAGYFPLEAVVDGLFAITQEVFGLRYEMLSEADVWHEDVTAYRITDSQTDELVAHFYMDLFPRDGKFSHAAAFPLVPSGPSDRPVAAIVANFTKPTDDQPALLQHDEVVTLFHEFGHILHMSLSQAEFARFASANTEWDFVEAPPQIMENWCWIPSVLERFARHHETDESIPSQLVNQLVAARDLNVSLLKLRQLLFGRIDMDLHNTLEEVDPARVLHDRSEISMFPFHEGTYFLASFGHLMGGYDAGYYGYLWSEVFGDDMFSRFEDEGVLSPEVGGEYRREILEPNGTKDAYDMLWAFLGREPDNSTFLKKLGISPQP